MNHSNTYINQLQSFELLQSTSLWNRGAKIEQEMEGAALPYVAT